VIRVDLAPEVLVSLRRGPMAAGRSWQEVVKNEIFDGATPYTTYVRGVIIDGDGGVLLTGRDDSALITKG
jgi:hypothetical protein